MAEGNFIEGIAGLASKAAQRDKTRVRKPFTVRDERIILDTPTPGDVAEVTRACQDPQIQRFTLVPVPYKLEYAKHFVTSLNARLWGEGGANWMIRVLSDDGTPQFVGTIALRACGENTANVGYWIAREFRGRGLMTSALKLAVRTAFNRLGFECVTWQGHPENLASRKVAWKAGFVCSAIVRGLGVNNRGQREDRILGTIVKGDAFEPRYSWEYTKMLGTSPNPRDPESLVRQFHEIYHLPIVTTGPDIENERMHMRLSLIMEESSELIRAFYGTSAYDRMQEFVSKMRSLDEHSRDTVEVADALADLTYVIYGMALEAGINLPAVLEEVQASNLSKLGEDGKPIYRQDGKVLKGPGFFEPNIARALSKNIEASR